MPVEADHRRGHQAAIRLADEEQLGLLGQLARDVAVGIVPGAGQATGLPQGNHGGFVGGAEGADLHARKTGVGEDRVNPSVPKATVIAPTHFGFKFSFEHLT
ncbi:hypothetical protein D3C81_1585610 [compost metagenome]